MSKQNIVRIKTHDTKKTYDFPGKDVPPLWEVKLELMPITSNGSSDSYGHRTAGTVYLEKETLLAAGLAPQNRQEPKNPEPTKTVGDLILELLEMLGVYPVE